MTEKRKCQFKVGDIVRFNKEGRRSFVITGFNNDDPLEIKDIREYALNFSGEELPWYFFDVGFGSYISEGYFEMYDADNPSDWRAEWKQEILETKARRWAIKNPLRAWWWNLKHKYGYAHTPVPAEAYD